MLERHVCAQTDWGVEHELTGMEIPPSTEQELLPTGACSLTLLKNDAYIPAIGFHT